RLAWLGIGLLPWIADPPAYIPALLVGMVFYFGLGSVGGCAFNSWMRDLIPEREMGSIFGKRMSVSVALGALLSLAAAEWVDYLIGSGFPAVRAYAILLLIGCFFGMIGATALAGIPEPRMLKSPNGKFIDILLAPFKNFNYRQLLKFLGSWNFSINLAAPFFTVYMLQRLELGMSTIVLLTVFSQFVNVIFFRIWGSLADRFTNKSVLAVSGPLFLLSTAAWPFTTLPEKHFLTMPLLIAIHAMAGISTAGVTLCAGNIALKLAPRGQATAFLATNALISGIAATIAPIFAGLVGDWFSRRELKVVFSWTVFQETPVESQLPALVLSGLDFLFLFSVLIGIYSLHRLLAVAEEGEVEEKVLIQEFYSEVRKTVKSLSPVAGVRHFFYFPYAVLKRTKVLPRSRPKN
ncbi:MAG: MFS transporter, partial [Candidatus Omnitrophica bacterium]|nr:MFS transporter [Candidatus Omnitrophota bacterium]